MSGIFRGGPGLGCISPHCNRVSVPRCVISIKKGWGCGFFGFLVLWFVKGGYVL